VRICVSSSLVPTNICNSRLVPKNNYKEMFVVFSRKGFHVNIVFHVVQLIYLICDFFLWLMSV
jgi:hypothetical protein